MEKLDENNNKFQQRTADLLAQAPQPFLYAFQSFSTGDINRAAVSFVKVIPILSGIDKVWEGNAHCCLAWALKEMGDYQNAIISAKRGKECGLNLVGDWYYYDAMIQSLDFMDNLPDSLSVIEEAIKFYRHENLPLYVADYLVAKVSVLKQMAYALSTDPMDTVYAYRMKNVPREITEQVNRRAFILKQMEPLLSKEQNHLSHAKNFILEAIRSICEDISIKGFQISEGTKEQFDAVANIAARVGVIGEDVAFIDNFGNVKPILEPYFGNKSLNSRAVIEYYNKGVSTREKGDRKAAAQYFQQAFNLLGDELPDDRAFKAFIAYQYGVLLWYMHGLENYRPTDYIREGNLSPSIKEAIKQIRALWNESLRLYSTLTNKVLADFDKRWPPGLTDAVWNIKRDPIMSAKF